MKDEDPQKTLDPEAIQQLIVTRTAVKRENTDNNINADDLPMPKDGPDADMADENVILDQDEEADLKETKKSKTQKQTKAKTTKTTTTKETKKYALQLTAPEQKEQKDDTDPKPPKPKKRITSLADVLVDPNPQPQKKTKQVSKAVVAEPDNENDNQPQENDSLITKKWGKRKTNS